MVRSHSLYPLSYRRPRRSIERSGRVRRRDPEFVLGRPSEPARKLRRAIAPPLDARIETRGDLGRQRDIVRPPPARRSPRNLTPTARRHAEARKVGVRSHTGTHDAWRLSFAGAVPAGTVSPATLLTCDLASVMTGSSRSAARRQGRDDQLDRCLPRSTTRNRGLLSQRLGTNGESTQASTTGLDRGLRKLRMA